MGTEDKTYVDARLEQAWHSIHDICDEERACKAKQDVRFEALQVAVGSFEPRLSILEEKVWSHLETLRNLTQQTNDRQMRTAAWLVVGLALVKIVEIYVLVHFLGSK